MYEDLTKANGSKFDTSDYANCYGIPVAKKKVLGKMKHEGNGKIISHFVNLRSKMYTFKIQGNKITKKSKGVEYNILKNKITFDYYLD